MGHQPQAACTRSNTTQTKADTAHLSQAEVDSKGEETKHGTVLIQGLVAMKQVLVLPKGLNSKHNAVPNASTRTHMQCSQPTRTH